jgi:hypothetical protein
VAYDALGDLEGTLADISSLPTGSSLTDEEWDARGTDLCRAAEMYLDTRAGSHLSPQSGTEC